MPAKTMIFSDPQTEAMKSEIDLLIEQRDAIKKDIEQKKAAHNQEIERSREGLRQQAAKIAEDRDSLKRQREEFNAIVSDFKQEKSGIERAKAEASDMKANYEKMNQKVGEFILLVKRSAEKL